MESSEAQLMIGDGNGLPYPLFEDPGELPVDEYGNIQIVDS